MDEDKDSALDITSEDVDRIVDMISATNAMHTNMFATPLVVQMCKHDYEGALNTITTGLQRLAPKANSNSTQDYETIPWIAQPQTQCPRFLHVWSLYSNVQRGYDSLLARISEALIVKRRVKPEPLALMLRLFSEDFTRFHSEATELLSASLLVLEKRAAEADISNQPSTSSTAAACSTTTTPSPPNLPPTFPTLPLDSTGEAYINRPSSVCDSSSHDEHDGSPPQQIPSVRQPSTSTMQYSNFVPGIGHANGKSDKKTIRQAPYGDMLTKFKIENWPKAKRRRRSRKDEEKDA